MCDCVGKLKELREFGGRNLETAVQCGERLSDSQERERAKLEAKFKRRAERVRGRPLAYLYDTTFFFFLKKKNSFGGHKSFFRDH